MLDITIDVFRMRKTLTIQTTNKEQLKFIETSFSNTIKEILASENGEGTYTSG